jgi:hypothetical protein
MENYAGEPEMKEPYSLCGKIGNNYKILASKTADWI